MKKILLADDDLFLAQSYKLKLEKDGFQVILAKNGVEVMNILETQTPDLILLDLVMPEQDGFETLEAIRKLDKFEKVPIIISTNLAQQEDMEKVKKLGAQEYFVKSDLNLHEFSDKIKEFLK